MFTPDPIGLDLREGFALPVRRSPDRGMISKGRSHTWRAVAAASCAASMIRRWVPSLS